MRKLLLTCFLALASATMLADELITNVELIISAFPEAGETIQTNSFAVSVPEGAGYNPYTWSFFEDEEYISNEYYYFLPGHTYVVGINVAPLEGYEFPSNNNMGDLSQITTSINGEEPYDQYGAWAGKPIVVLQAQFTIEGELEDGIVTHVDLNISSFPKDGEDIYDNSFKVSALGEGYEFSGMLDFYENDAILNDDDIYFHEGHTYVVAMQVTLKEGYTFPVDDYGFTDPEQITITINGEEPYHSYIVEVGDPVLWVQAQFTVIHIEVFTDVALYISAFPQAGETIMTNSFAVSAPGYAGYEPYIWSFFENDNYIDDQDYVFQSGHTYMVEINVRPLEGYEFPNDGEYPITNALTMTINGEEPYGYYGAWAGVPIIVLQAQFTIGNVGIDENAQNSKVRARKVLRDGKLYIEYDGKTYNIMGAEIR